MGLRKTHLELINLGASYCGFAKMIEGRWVYDNFKMAELGSQNIKGPLKDAVSFSISKDYFESVGIEHTSFDITGKYNAIALDLGEEQPEYWGQFDLVTNFATSEHVRNEYNCFKNIHNFCKQGGAIAHAIPREASWPNHCYHYYNARFFQNLAMACGYELILIREMTKQNDIATYVNVLYPGESGDQINMQCLVIKTNDNEFISEEEFRKLRD